MKKLVLVLLLLIIGSVVAYSQERSEKQIEWVYFAQLGEEFTVEVPIFPKSFSHSLDNSSRRYYRLVDKTYYYIFVDSFQKRTQGFTRLNLPVKKFVNQFRQNGKMGRFGEFIGEKFEFADDEGFYHIVLIVKTAKHIYTFQTVSESKNDVIAGHFFSSLKLGGNTFLIDQNDLSSNNENSNPNADTKVPETGIGNGNVVKPNPNPTNHGTPLVILTKPRGNYSEFSRFYSIQGTVTAIATFSADGTVGNVEIASRLPFGLTKNTIEAIKSIKFRPATKDGIPHSTVKKLQYSYSFF